MFAPRLLQRGATCNRGMGWLFDPGAGSQWSEYPGPRWAIGSALSLGTERERVGTRRGEFLLNQRVPIPLLLSPLGRIHMATTRGTKTRQPQQGLLSFPCQHGGSRDGAGRNPKGERAGVSHGPRALLAARFPAHVTLKVTRGLPRLRQRAEYGAMRAAFAAGCRGTARAESGGMFRLCHYAVLNDHLHLIVEARDRRERARGVQGLAVRIAKALNKLWRRRG